MVDSQHPLTGQKALVTGASSGIGAAVAIAPGALKTAINKDAWSTPAAREKLLELIPYGRIGEPEDVARTAVWLASDASDDVTGTTCSSIAE